MSGLLQSKGYYVYVWKSNGGVIYRLDTETKGSTRFRNPRALGCSVPSAARALLRARGFLNRVDPIGLSV